MTDYVQRYWMGGALQMWVVEAADYDKLAAAHLRARDKLLELAKECSSCGGTGVVTVMREPDSRLYSGVLISREEPCGDCFDIREVLDQ